VSTLSCAIESPAPKAQSGLESMAEKFRSKVTNELQYLEPTLRSHLRGDYLFYVDAAPSFLLNISSQNCWSAQFLETLKGWCVALPNQSLSIEELHPHARVLVHTDSATLGRLLAGTMKARAAFLAEKVRIEGDLPCFLRLIQLLKDLGVKPLHALPDETPRYASVRNP
jgi:hypothetical protein